MRITVGYTEHVLQRIDERGFSMPTVKAILRNPKDVELNRATRNPIHNTYSFAFDDYGIIATPNCISDRKLPRQARQLEIRVFGVNDVLPC